MFIKKSSYEADDDDDDDDDDGDNDGDDNEMLEAATGSVL